MPYYPPDTPRYYFGPTDRNLLAETFPAVYASTNTAVATAGTVSAVKIRLAVPSSVTNIVLWLVTNGGTLTSGQCFAALYTGAGALIAQTADQASAWGTGAPKVLTMALAAGPFARPAGDHYVALWFNGTTGPALARYNGVSSAMNNVGLASPNMISCTADTGITTTAPSSLGAQTASLAWWAALS